MALVGLIRLQAPGRGGADRGGATSNSILWCVRQDRRQWSRASSRWSGNGCSLTTKTARKRRMLATDCRRGKGHIVKQKENRLVVAHPIRIFYLFQKLWYLEFTVTKKNKFSRQKCVHGCKSSKSYYWLKKCLRTKVILTRSKSFKFSNGWFTWRAIIWMSCGRTIGVWNLKWKVALFIRNHVTLGLHDSLTFCCGHVDLHVLDPPSNWSIKKWPNRAWLNFLKYITNCNIIEPTGSVLYVCPWII